MRQALAFLAVAAAGLAGCGGTGGSLEGGASPDGVSADGVSGREFHVAPTGSDAAPGTAGQPWKTLQHAADTARAGDTVYVHAGRYAEEVRFRRSGTVAAPIVFRHAPTEWPTVRSLQLERGASHVRLAGFRVTGFAVWGVTLTGDNTDIALSRLNISGGECGIHFTDGYSGQPPAHGPVSDLLVQDCIVRDVQYTGIDATPGPLNRGVFRRVKVYGCGLVGPASFGADGIGIEKGEQIMIEDCDIHDNGGDGIDLNSRDRSGWAKGIVVRGNVVARNHLQGIKLWAGGRMEQNAVWGQGICPVMIGAYDCGAQVLGNTVAYNMWSGDYGVRDYAATIGYHEPGGHAARVRLTMRNNLWAFNTGPAVGSPTGLYLGPRVQLVNEGRNVYFSRPDGEVEAAFLSDRSFTRTEIRNGTWAAATGQGQGDLCVDPQFVSGWPNVDLHLQPGSPATGRGAYP